MTNKEKRDNAGLNCEIDPVDVIVTVNGEHGYGKTTILNLIRHAIAAQPGLRMGGPGADADRTMEFIFVRGRIE